MNSYTSAGTVLISFESRKVLLIKHPEGHWGFPKGFIEKGESPFMAAQRELLEEVGIRCNFFMNPEKYFYEEQYSFVGTDKHVVSKHVVYYIGVTCNTEYVLETAFKDCRWVDFSELYALPNFKSVQIVNELESLITKEICWVNSGEGNFHADNEDIMASKHIFSRVVPLLEYSSNVKIKNAPNILDSYYMYEILRKSKALHNKPMILHEEDVNKCWSSVNILPFLVFNHGKVVLESKPSGCRIGQRSIDLYLEIMKQCGFNIQQQENQVVLLYEPYRGNINLSLPFPSFTGTSMAIYCAMLSNGKTHLQNISLEPEIMFLIEQVKAMGWDIKLEERDLYIVRTSDVVTSIEIEIPADRNILVTRIVDSLINNKRFFYKSNYGLYLSSLIHYFDNIGVKYEYDHNSILIYENQLGKLKQIPIVCDHYPALCSDWQPMLVYLSLLNSGQVEVTDKVFEKRFGYFNQLAMVYKQAEEKITEDTMVAKIEHSFHDNIPERFECLDIRASAVLFMMLENDFKVSVHNLTQLLRGYSNVSQISPSANKLGNFEFI